MIEYFFEITPMVLTLIYRTLSRLSYRIIGAQDALHNFRHKTISKEDESVPFACRIALGDDGSMQELQRNQD